MGKLNKILIVAKKEIKELIVNKRSLIISLVLAGWFGFIYGQNITRAGISLDIVLYILGLTMATFLSFILSAQIFMREKFDKTIIDLFCTPLSLQEILLGKVIGVFAFTYGFSLLSVLVVLVTGYFQSGILQPPSSPLLFHIFLNIPIFIIFAVSLNGLIQLVLGIKENRIAYFITYVIVFGAMFLVTRFVDNSYKISWAFILVSFIVICFLALVIFLITKTVRKEKIITTID